MTPKTCIYCGTALTPTTREAHVVPAGLGGRLRSREVCCDDCNNAFSVPEGELQQALMQAGAAVGARKDDNKPISVKISIDGMDFVLADAVGDLQTAGARFDRESRSMVVPLPAGLDNQARAMARAMWNQGLGVDDVEKLTIEPGDPEPVMPAAPHFFDLSVGSKVGHKRTIVKMPIELLAVHRHDLAASPEFAPARDFARNGTGKIRAWPDARSVGSGLLVTALLPEVFNSVEIWTADGAVNFRVWFLGAIAFSGVLAPKWMGEAFRVAHAFDARRPASVVVSTYERRHGDALSKWPDWLQLEAGIVAIQTLERMSLKLRDTNRAPSREPPPDVLELRRVVRDHLAKLPPKERRKKGGA